MHIAFLCPSVSRAVGGIFETERRLAQSIASPEIDLQIFAPIDKQTLLDLPSWSPLKPKHFRRLGPPTFGFSPQLKKAFLSENFDLVHVHGLWTYNSRLAQIWSDRWKRPYLVTVHGMLDPWAVRNSGWKKKITLTLYERRFLESAACIQVLSLAELRSVRAFGLSNPICVIPNGMDLPEESSEKSASPWADKITPGQKVLLYLGRIHPKKGLVNLLEAWARKTELEIAGPKSSWVLAIVGWDQSGHETELKELCQKLAIEDSVLFLGPKFEDEKAACYRYCDAFILPSLSEGLPLVVLEAWVYTKPVLMTPECNLPEGFSSQAAIRIAPEPGSILEGLSLLFAMSDRERDTMGGLGFSLVKDRFTWQKIAAETLSVYRWLLGNTGKPDCVVL